MGNNQDVTRLFREQNEEVKDIKTAWRKNGKPTPVSSQYSIYIYGLMSYQFEVQATTDGVLFHYNSQHVAKSGSRLFGDRNRNMTSIRWRLSYPGKMLFMDRSDRLKASKELEKYLRIAPIGDVAARFKLMPIKGVGIEDKLMDTSIAEMKELVWRFSNGTRAT
jgi:hypothetical protein